MRKKKLARHLLVAATLLSLYGCATPDNNYHDETEYSDMPWNTPQQWEGSRQIPGLSGGSGSGAGY